MADGLHAVSVLWSGKTKAGRPKISGKLGAVRIMLLANENRRSPSSPDWKMFICFDGDCGIPEWQRKAIASALSKIGMPSPFHEE